MTKLNKVEGATEKCPTCKAMIHCRMKPAQGKYPEKLQWQNFDGSAHYDYKDGDFVCKTGSAPKETALQIKTVWTNAELDEKGEEFFEGLKAFKNIAYHLTKHEHPELSDQDNLFGQIVNANTAHVIQLALIKAIKSKGDSN